jgi:ribonuclease HII
MFYNKKFKGISMKTEHEIKLKIEEKDLVIFGDEVNAGGLCFDLFVCGIVITKESLAKLPDVNDSKKLTEKKRTELFPKIIELAVDYELVRITPQEVDRLNIFQARMEGFKRAIDILSKRTGATYAVIDGNKKPENTAVETDVLVKADAILPGVSCASIVAKHSHTLAIYEISKQEPYSKYGLEKHKGYGTKVHMEALKKYGPIEGFHRYSYQPVKDSIKI